MLQAIKHRMVKTRLCSMTFVCLKQDESLAKKLVAPQFYSQSHHATLSTHSTHSQEPGPSSIVKLFQNIYHSILILAACMGTYREKKALPSPQPGPRGWTHHGGAWGGQREEGCWYEGWRSRKSSIPISKPPITTVSPVLCNIIPLSLHNQLVTRACTAAVMIHSLLAWTATCY